jgi:predicted dehydrogenase
MPEAAAMHTLAFLDPGHFHAALTLGVPNPRVRQEIFVYAPEGPELDDFLALVDAFNRRPVRPTAWHPVVRAGRGSLERLIGERPGDIAILAGRNDRKMSLMRRLHDAGFHILADKPWLAGPDGLDDLRHVLAGGPLAVEIMTGRLEITTVLTRELVADRELFGDFEKASDPPGIQIASVHHLEKTVNGAPLRRPPWFFDVRVQGDGIADLPTHMVDAAQRLVAAHSPGMVPGTPLELTAARRWTTRVPRALFARVTGEPDFHEDLRGLVTGSELLYEGNAALSFRLHGVTVALETRWDLSAPPGGGDSHRSVIRGSRAEIYVEQSAATGFARRLTVVSRLDAARARAALERIVSGWQDERPGIDLAPGEAGWEIRVPRALDGGHESHFPFVLADVVALADSGRPSADAAGTAAKYALLAQASVEAQRVHA